MSQFGKPVESNDGFVNKIYTGVENFKVVAVNPNHTELKKIWGENAKEPSYIGETEVEVGGEKKKVTNLRLAFFLENEPEEGEEKITATLNFWVAKTTMVSTKGAEPKYEVINLFGSTAWLTEDEIKAKQDIYDIGGKGTYMFKGDSVRKAFRGEGILISMLRNLLNLPSPDKAEDKMSAASFLTQAEWEQLFSGNLTIFKNMVSSTPNKIGVVLGANVVGDKIYQNVFSQNTLRQYVKKSGKFDFINKKVAEQKANGAYETTDFGPSDLVLREFDAGAKPTDNAVTSGGFGGETSTGFEDAGDAFGEGDDSIF